MASLKRFVKDADDDGRAFGAGDLGPRRRARQPAVRVLHTDSDVVIVDKAPGVGVETRAGHGVVFEDVTGADRSIEPIESPNDLVVVYPMDDETSGVLVLARSLIIRDRLLEDMRVGRLDVCYLAIVNAIQPADTGEVDAPIRMLAEHTQRVKIDPAAGRPALTTWRTRDAFIAYALLECHPRTAAPNQLRVHLQHAGMPLVVDPEYGGAEYLMLSSFKAGYRRSRRHPERPLIARVSLFAASVRMTQPSTGAPLSFEAAMPKDFRAAVHQLERFGRIPRATK